MTSGPLARPPGLLVLTRLLGSLLLVVTACSGFDGAVRDERSPRHSLPVMQLTGELPAPPEGLATSAPGLSHVIGLWLSPSLVPPDASLDEWLRELARQGVTLLLLDIGTRLPDSSARSLPEGSSSGVYFRSVWAPLVRDVFSRLVPIARQYHVSVFGVASTRGMPWIDPGLGWRDRAFDPGQRQLRDSTSLDLFHPGFQEYLVGLLSDLTETGVDGVLFYDDPPLGLYDGLSAHAIQRFERDFGTRLDIAQLFTAASHPGGGSARYRPEFWRWIGWRARARLELLDHVSQAMKMKNPDLQFALEVHPYAVTDPVGALALHSEDLLEAKRRFRYFLLTPAAAGNRPQRLTTDTEPVGLLQQMTALLGSAQRIWLSRPAPTDPVRLSDRGAAMERGEDDGPGVVYVTRVSVP